MSAPEPSKVVDAEFVDVQTKAPEASPPRTGYGRRTTAGPPSVVEATADLLDVSAPLIDAAGNVAEAIGMENGSERAKNVANVVRAGAEVARAAPAAVAAIRRDIQPVKSAFGRLVDAAKRSGIVGERRTPIDFERVERKPKGEK